MSKMEALTTHAHRATGLKSGGVHSPIVVTLLKVFTFPKALLRVATSCFVGRTMRDEALLAPESYATFSRQGVTTEELLDEQSNRQPRRCVPIIPLRNER
jgi:hypothetical protein